MASGNNFDESLLEILMEQNEKTNHDIETKFSNVISIATAIAKPTFAEIESSIVLYHNMIPLIENKLDNLQNDMQVDAESNKQKKEWIEKITAVLQDAYFVMAKLFLWSEKGKLAGSHVSENNLALLAGTGSGFGSISILYSVLKRIKSLYILD